MWQYRHTNEMYHNALESRPYYAVSYNDDDIYHYGVMGMKWGIRKQRETTGTGRGRGRKKLTAKQKKLIKNIAIGTGVASGIAGGVALGAVARQQIKQMGGLQGIRNARQAARLANGGKRVGLNTLGTDAVLASKRMNINPGGRITGTYTAPMEITKAARQRKAVKQQASQYARFERGWAKASKSSPEAAAANQVRSITNSRGFKKANTTKSGVNLNLTPGGYVNTPRRRRR